MRTGCVYRFLSIAIGAAALALQAEAAPLVGSPPGSAAVNVAIGAVPQAAPPAAVPERFAVVSAIRVVYRERLGLPPGYMQSARARGLVGFFAAQGSEGAAEVTPDAVIGVFSARNPVATGWPRGPEFVSRRPATALARESAPLDWTIPPQWIDRTARLDLDRRLAEAPSATRTDADPTPPPSMPPLNPAGLIAAFSTPRGQPGYVRFAFPPGAGTIVLALPALPVDAAADPGKAYIFDLSTQNVLRVFNNPAATLAALFAGLVDDPFDPAPLAPAPAAPLRLAGTTASGIGGTGGIGGPGVPPVTLDPNNGGGGGGGGLRPPPPVSPVPLPLPLAALLGALCLLAIVTRRRRAPV